MENQEQKQPELSLSDLKNIRILLDVASKRGAFGAAELSSVGAVFDRLNIFLNSVEPAPLDAAQPLQSEEAQ